MSLSKFNPSTRSSNNIFKHLGAIIKKENLGKQKDSNWLLLKDRTGRKVKKIKWEKLGVWMPGMQPETGYFHQGQV